MTPVSQQCVGKIVYTTCDDGKETGDTGADSDIARNSDSCYLYKRAALGQRTEMLTLALQLREKFMVSRSSHE